ncbi:MAG: DUF4079 domain-containing protein [Thermostichales cyanobacterium BF4_bins_65]
MVWQLPKWLDLALPFFHPLLMWLTFGVALYALYLGMQSRRVRSSEGETKKALIKGKFAQRHYQLGSLFLVLMVAGSAGGMAATYIKNGKLFVGPHLLVGLGLTVLVALAAALAPALQQGKAWARSLHIALNLVVLGLLGWQAATGVQIVQRIVAQMTTPVA